MAYNRYFNNAMAIFTAFAAEMKPGVSFDWQKLYPEDFAAPSDYAGVSIHANGVADIVRIYRYSYDDSCSYVSTFNKSTGAWETVSAYGYPLFYEGNGQFFGLRQEKYSYRSADGLSWTSMGGLPGFNDIPAGYKKISCAVTNGASGIIVPNTMFSLPLWYRSDITKGGNWNVSQSEFTKFEALAWHKGMYVSASRRSSHFDNGGIYTSVDGNLWDKMLSLPNKADSYYKGDFLELASVNGRLFVKTECAERNGAPSVFSIGVFDDSFTSYTDVLSFPMRLGDADSFSRVPSLCSLKFVPELGKYLMFGKSSVYASEDGYSWTVNPQMGIEEELGSAVYVCGKGLYVNPAEKNNYIYFAPCP